MKAFLSKIIIFFIIFFFGLSCNEKEICATCLAYENDIPPIANAGPDINVKYDIQKCYMERVILDGTASTDSDGNITRYTWSVIAPFKKEIQESGSIITFTNFENGEYQIQLQVNDNLGKYAFDTLKVTVTNDFSKTLSDVTINFSTIAEIPVPYRSFNFIGGSETKLLFMGNIDIAFGVESLIAMFDVQSLQWKGLQLSQPRAGFSTLITGEKIFFAGGGYKNENSWNFVSEKIVDIYDIATGVISTSNLIDARTEAGAENFGTKVYFIGGTQFGAINNEKSINNIEIYDTLTKTWSIIQLPAKSGNKYVRSENKLYFLDEASISTNRNISILDLETNSWSGTESNLPFRAQAGVAFTNNIYWLGNHLESPTEDYNYEALIMYNIQNRTSNYTCLPGLTNSNSIFSKNNKLFIYKSYQDFITANNAFGYIFNPATGQWYNGISDNFYSYLGIYNCGKEVFAIANHKIYRVDF